MCSMKYLAQIYFEPILLCARTPNFMQINNSLENMSESEERKTIYLCLAHMSETGEEQKYVKEAFDTNWGLISE